MGGSHGTQLSLSHPAVLQSICFPFPAYRKDFFGLWLESVPRKCTALREKVDNERQNRLVNRQNQRFSLSIHFADEGSR